MNQPHDEQLDQFTITFRREIVFYLRQLVNDGDQVSVIFDEGRETCLTVLLDVDDEAGEIIFDWGGSEETNQRLLKSDRNFFVARPGGVRNQFITGRPREITYNKRRAFAVKIPDKYIRLQRREFFRLTLPMTQRPPCRMSGPSDKEIEFSVIDIGLGGVGLEIPVLPMPCEVGTLLEKTRIDLKASGVLHVNLEVRYIGSLVRGAKQHAHLGCRFEKLTAAQENALQRFITQVQREERAKLGL